MHLAPAMGDSPAKLTDLKQETQIWEAGDGTWLQTDPLWESTISYIILLFGGPHRALTSLQSLF